MKKITIKICTGTACYVLGGANILMLEDYIPGEIKDIVGIEGSACLELCKQSQYGKPPFVVVNEKVITEATVPKILDYLNKLTGKDL